ncbi:hypothetical protein F4776DRAFT_479369 [Hypoxylon sp. NC0597]|nr:hypothetical protein F4776DRAFT_479369 [Hypoxylon sp. NC0597]
MNGSLSEKYEPCDISINSGSSEPLALARVWLDTCRNSHSKCAHRTEKFVPHRLLDISHENPRLVLRTEVQHAEFIAGVLVNPSQR